jgi:hypothetical protein
VTSENYNYMSVRPILPAPNELRPCMTKLPPFGRELRALAIPGMTITVCVAWLPLLYRLSPRSGMFIYSSFLFKLNCDEARMGPGLCANSMRRISPLAGPLAVGTPSLADGGTFSS